MRSGDVRFRGRAHHFVIDVIVRFGRFCLATLRGVRDPAAQLAFELEYAKSDYGLGVAPAHIGQIKSQKSVFCQAAQLLQRRRRRTRGSTRGLGNYRSYDASGVRISIA